MTEESTIPPGAMPDTYFDPAPLDSPVAAPPARPADTLTEDEADAAAYREDAFSGEFFWQGEKLHPFSVERYAVFVSHRLSLGAPRLFAALSDGTAFFPDALRILWLCAHDREAIQRLRSEPAAMARAIDDWAAHHATVANAHEAVRTAIKIFNYAHANEPEHRPEAKPRRGDDALGN